MSGASNAITVAAIDMIDSTLYLSLYNAIIVQCYHCCSLNASGAIDLSQSAVSRLLSASGATAKAADEGAIEWAKHWGEYLVDSSAEGIYEKLQVLTLLQCALM